MDSKLTARVQLARECDTQDGVTVNFYDDGDILIRQGEDRVYLSALQLSSLLQVLKDKQ